MVGEGLGSMRVQELRRIPVRRQVRAPQLTQVKAGALVGRTAQGIDHVRRRTRPHRAWQGRRSLWARGASWRARILTGPRAGDPAVRGGPAPTVTAHLAGTDPVRQCGRALGARGVAWIPVYAPPAKGRIERLVSPIQARVSNEMRRAGGSTLDAANQCAAADRHWPSPARRERARIRCIQTTRCLRTDVTRAHQRTRDQMY